MKKQTTFLTLLLILFLLSLTNAQTQKVRVIRKEDYKARVPSKPDRTPKAPLLTHTWTGTVSSDWNTAGNWDTGTVPTSSDNVTIPDGTPYSPVIGSSSSAYCANLFLQTDAVLTQNTGSYFFCYGTFDAGFGQFTMNGYSYLYFRGSGNTLWWDDNQNDTYSYVRVEKLPSTASITMQTDMSCSGTFEIREGVFKIKDGTDNENRLTVHNTGNNAFKVEDGGTLVLDGFFETIWVDGGIIFKDGSQLLATDGFLVTEGNFKVENNTLYDIEFTGGYLQISGNGTQYIQDLDGGNLRISTLTIFKPSGICYIANADLFIESDISISNNGGYYSGKLSCRTAAGSSTVYNIYVKSGWYSENGYDGFDEATGRVIFNGTGDQQCYSETFNELEISKSSGHFVVYDGKEVTCAAYDWEAGEIEVNDGGSFTANDLLDNAIQGGFILHDGGTINLTNSGGSGSDYVDLKGDLHIEGGTMNVTGSISWWPYQEDASIEMSGGTLNFTSCGIQIDDNAYSLTSNITGGTIRTAGGFVGNRADFTPTGGTFEFYGSSDVNLSQSNGCTLYNVNIDKSSKSQVQLKPGVISPDGRIDKTISEGKSNMAYLNSNFTVTNDFDIASGGFSMSSYELNVAHAMDVYGDFHMNNVANALTMGQSGSDQMTFYSGSIGDFTAGMVNMYGGIYTESGCAFTATTANTVVFKGIDAVGLENNEPSVVFGNMEVMKNSGHKMAISNVSFQPVIVNGDFTIHPDNIFETQTGSIIVHGNFTDDPTSEIYVYETDSPTSSGYLEMDNDFTLLGLLDVGNGDVLLHGDFQTETTSTITINGGSFIDDSPYQGSFNWMYINGNFNMTNGLFELTYNGPYYSTSANTNISGGIIRPLAFCAVGGVFNPTGGEVEIIGNLPNLNIYCFTGSTFYNLRINALPSSVIHYRTDMTLTNDLIIDSGSLECGYLSKKSNSENLLPSKMTETNSSMGNAMANSNYPVTGNNGKNTKATDHQLTILGDWTDNSGGFIPNEGKVIFYGPNTSSIATNETFYNLEENKSLGGVNGLNLNNGSTVNVLNDLEITDGTMEMNPVSTLNVDGNIHIASGAGLNANSDLYLNIVIGGDFSDDNAFTSDIEGYFPGTETITFDGTTDQIITTAATEEKFGNLVIDKASGEFKPNDNIYVIHDFTLQNGDWADNVNGLSHSFEEDFTVNAGGYFSNAVNKNTVNFVSGKDAEIHFASSGVSNGIFNAVVIDKAPTKAFAPENGEISQSGNTDTGKAPLSQNVTLTSNVFCGYSAGVTVQNGTLDLNGYMLTSTGDLNINSAGTVNAGPGSILKIDQDNFLEINSGGTLFLSGTSGSPATVTHYNPGYYSFNINDGGTLSAEYAIFEYISEYGLNIQSGATLDPSHAFNHCTFENIEPGIFSSDITFNNDQTLTCTDVNFPDNPGYNVWKSNNAGDITFEAATGEYAGPEYEYDPYERVHWSDIDVELDLAAILEGAYNGTNMNTGLRDKGLLPLSQPFNQWPWNYTGSESVTAIPADVVDWVLVQLRDADSPAAADASSLVNERAAFLLKNGGIVDLDGVSPLILSTSYNRKLYAVVCQYNHLAVVSSTNLVRDPGGKFTYDFTGGAYGGVAGEKEVSPGVWALYGGDCDGDGNIDDTDIYLWKIFAGQSDDYFWCDMDMNGDVDNKDKNDICVPNMGTASQVVNPYKNMTNKNPRIK